ncbi:MAG: hypothetical protein H2174_02125 [Vampirovibrio sp.]|nr:hypothetical protein [Vampirovibrio sp.]
MMMMTSGINAVNSPVQPRSVGASAYAPSYRPEDERQAFVAPLATTLGVGTLGAMGVAAWENTNAPKRYALNEFDKAVKAELANNPTTTPATPQNSKGGFVSTAAHEQVMSDYLKTLKNADTSDVFTPKEIKRLSKQHLGDVRAAIAKKTGGDALATAFDTAFSTKKVTGEKLTAYERLSAYDKAIDKAARQQYYDDGVKKMLAGQTHSDGTTPFHSDAKAVEAKLADIANPSKPAITMKSHLEAIRDAKIADFEGELKGTKGSLNNGEQARLAQKTAELNKTMEEQLKAYEKLDDIRTGKNPKFRQQKPGNTPPTQTARTNASTLTEAEARTNVLNGTTGKKVATAEVNRLFENGKVATPTDAGKVAIKEFGDNAIKKAGDWEVKGKSMATKGGLILAGAAVVGTIAGVVNSGNVRANNEAQLNALLAQERAASA